MIPTDLTSRLANEYQEVLLGNKKAPNPEIMRTQELTLGVMMSSFTMAKEQIANLCAQKKFLFFSRINVDSKSKLPKEIFLHIYKIIDSLYPSTINELKIQDEEYSKLSNEIITHGFKKTNANLLKIMNIRA